MIYVVHWIALIYIAFQQKSVFQKGKENPLFNQQCSQERRRNPSSYKNKIGGEKKKVYRTLELIDI